MQISQQKQKTPLKIQHRSVQIIPEATRSAQYAWNSLNLLQRELDLNAKKADVSSFNIITVIECKCSLYKRQEHFSETKILWLFWNERLHLFSVK